MTVAFLARPASAASSAVTRRVAGRQLSTTAKMHKAKDMWPSMKAKRPIDHDDEHLVFHPPFNKIGMIVGVGAVIAIGWGSMAFGFIHQQYKQGFYK